MNIKVLEKVRKSLGTLSLPESAFIIFSSCLFCLVQWLRVLMDIEGLDCATDWCLETDNSETKVTSELCSPCCRLLCTSLRFGVPLLPLIELLWKQVAYLPLCQDTAVHSVPTTDCWLRCGFLVCCSLSHWLCEFRSGNGSEEHVEGQRCPGMAGLGLLGAQCLKLYRNNILSLQLCSLFKSLAWVLPSKSCPF